MGKLNAIENVYEFCQDLQEKVHLHEVTTDINSLRFSCDLLLRNMLMILEKERSGESFTKEMHYIANNLLGTHAHLTGEDALITAKKYNMY